MIEEIKAEEYAQYESNTTDQDGIPLEIEWKWPEELVMDVGRMFLISDGKFTVTSSYLQDRQELPGLWTEVYQYVRMRRAVRKMVEGTLNAVRNG